jgi:virginiamycin B lyase
MRALLALALLAPALLAAQSPGALSTTWTVPFGADSRPRDPFADAEGRVWFVGQQGNYVAYMESRTKRWRRYEIDAGTNPHNLVVEKGMVWFTGNRNGRLVKLDPASGKLTTYRLPDSTVRDPHTIVFDPRTGIAWFTAQNSDAVGRFDPATGGFRFWKTGARSRPYGIVLDSRGRPWFDLFGTNKLASIDPRTMELTEHVLPAADAHPRRIAITSDDQVYWGDYTRGFLGHLDPRTGRMDEVALPAGRASLPYGMTTDDRDMIWVAQNGQSSTAASLVAFDPRSRKFVATIPIGEPGPNTIRHMTFDRATRQIWFGTDQGTIGMVSVPRVALVP